MYSATRYHDISCGHRVVGHEGKCRFLHGHNYRVHFTVEPGKLIGQAILRPTNQLDGVGRVIDFSVIKQRLCMWLESNWDHKMLLWSEDSFVTDGVLVGLDGVVILPFNPTAENMARHLALVVGPAQLEGTGTVLTKVVVEETRKCSAEYVIP